jgi:hypothetical protein
VVHVCPALQSAEAVQIMLDLEAQQALGIRWGTFQLTDEARDEPARRLTAALAARNIDAARFRAAAPAMVLEAPGSARSLAITTPLIRKRHSRDNGGPATRSDS